MQPWDLLLEEYETRVEVECNSRFCVDSAGQAFKPAGCMVVAGKVSGDMAGREVANGYGHSRLQFRYDPV